MNLSDFPTSQLQKIISDNRDSDQVTRAEIELKRRGVVLGSLEFLSHFKINKPYIAKYFFVAAKFKKDPKEVVSLVNELFYSALISSKAHVYGKRRNLYELIVKSIDSFPKEAEQFAVFMLSYRNLDSESQKMVKEVQKLHLFRKKSLPSPSQIDYIQSLGSGIVPESKEEASLLITKLRLDRMNNPMEEPATEKQINYLRLLGHKGDINNKEHATYLIQNILAKEKNKT